MRKIDIAKKSKVPQQLVAMIVVLCIAVLGTVLVLVSKASTPYISINSDKGTLSSPAVVQSDPNSSDGRSVQFGSVPTITPPTPPPPVPSGAIVSKVPDAAYTPAGGWSVAYANAFGSCLTESDTTCATGAARSDNTLIATNGHPSNSNEPTWYVPGQNVVTSHGLDLNCTWSPGIASGKNYACGEVTSRTAQPDGSGDPAGYKLFHFSPGHGETWAFQAVVKTPPTTGESDPGWWASGYHWAWEIDFPEWWGWHAGSGGKNWCPGGDGMGMPAVPRTNFGGAAGEGVTSFCKPGSNFSPDAAYHTYTVVMNGTTFSSYIDGQPLTWSYGAGSGKTSFSVGNASSWSADMGSLIMQHSLRDPTVGNPDPYFTGGTRTLSVRSISVYENTTAHGSNAVNAGLIAPGTSVQ